MYIVEINIHVSSQQIGIIRAKTCQIINSDETSTRQKKNVNETKAGMQNKAVALIDQKPLVSG